MDLKAALTAAEKHAGKSDGYELVTIGPDFVAARNDVTGIRIDVLTGWDKDPVQVNATAVRKMVAKAGKDVVVRSGRMFTIQGTLGEFTLQSTRSKLWEAPKLPARWKALSEAEAAAVRAVAELASPTKDDPLSSVRLSPYLTASRTFSSIAVCYVTPVTTPVTVPRAFLLKAPACEIGVKAGRVFLKTETSVTWSLTLDEAYPDQTTYQAIGNARDIAGETCSVDVRQLIPLVERAALACRVPADAGWLVLRNGLLGASLASDLGGYQGDVGVEGGTDEKHAVGVRPPQLLRFLKALKGAQGDNRTWVRISGRRDPLYICTQGTPAVEVVLQPVFVRGE